MKHFLPFILFLFLLSSKGQTLITNNFNINLGWTVAHTSGTATNVGWSKVTSGTYPTCMPYEGAGMARFYSYGIVSGNVYTLTSPAINFLGSNYTVNFYMYRDGGYAGYADNIKVYYKTTTSETGVLLGTVNRSTALEPQVSSDGWYFYSFYLPANISGTGYISLMATSEYGNNIFVDNISVVTAPAHDGILKSLTTSDYALENSIQNITGIIENGGSSTINSMDVTWNVDGGTSYVQNLTGLNIPFGQEYSFSHANTWAAVTGNHTYNVTISNINGSDSNDVVLTNNTKSKGVFVVKEIFPKNVVYEEGTGTWCGWCIRGHVGLKDMAHFHDDGSWIGIAVHNGDPMVLTEYDSSLAVSGYPSGLINRNSVEVDPDSETLEDTYLIEVQKVPEGKINITGQSWDSTTRQISVTVTATFALDMNNINYKPGVIVIENGVTGTTSGYNQVNYYNSNGIDIIDYEGINWRNLANPIPAANMIYNHVGRALLGGFNGQAGVIPVNVVYNTPYSYTFNYTLPASYDELEVELVAVLINGSNGRIVNSEKMELNTILGVNDENGLAFRMLPNPAKEVLFFTSEKPLEVEVYNSIGKLVLKQSGVFNSAMNTSDLNSGVYFVRAFDGSKVGTTKLVIE